MHVLPYILGADETSRIYLFQVFVIHEFELVIDGVGQVLFQLFGYVLDERAPFRGGGQGRNEESSYSGGLHRRQYKA